MTARALLATLFLGLFATTLSARTAGDTPAAFILCYHIVESPQDPRMEVSREAFRQQIRYLAMTGYNIIPLRHLYEYVTGKRTSIPRNAVVVTIDDGWRSTYTEVFPEMQKRKFPFTVFIYPRIIGQTAHALSWKQVKEMSEAGVDIQSHSLSHPYLSHRRHTALDGKTYTEWLRTELSESKRILERETGHRVEFLAYPYGDYDPLVASASVRAGYAAALTCEFGRVRRGSDPQRMKRFVIDKRMDFSAFRHYLGANPLRLEETAPLPNQVFEPEQPVVVSARIPNHNDLDPKSVGMALLSAVSPNPFSYDARSGSISMVIRDVLATLQGKSLRALVWATESKSGKRVEATWTFRMPDAPLPQQAIPLPPMIVTPHPAYARPGATTGEIMQPPSITVRTQVAAARPARK